MSKAKKKKTATVTKTPLGLSAFSEPKAEELKQAFLILKYARESSESFFQTFRTSRKGKTSGTTSDEEQDLLRAMVVFAAAGLDSLLKQIVKDALPKILEKSEAAQVELQKYTQRALRGRSRTIGSEEDEGDDWLEIDKKFLAEILIADSPRDAVIERLVGNLIGESLQSTEQIFKVIRCLGLDEKSLEIGKNKEGLDKIFKARNQIIHEMDIDFSQPRRNRFTRSQTTMKNNAKALLEFGAKLLSAADTQLSN